MVSQFLLASAVKETPKMMIAFLWYQVEMDVHLCKFEMTLKRSKTAEESCNPGRELSGHSQK